MEKKEKNPIYRCEFTTADGMMKVYYSRYKDNVAAAHAVLQRLQYQPWVKNVQVYVVNELMNLEQVLTMSN